MKPPFADQAWQFAGCPEPLILPAEGSLAAALQSVLPGWPVTAQPSDGAGMARAALQADGRYRITSHYTDRPTGAIPTAGAVCALMADLMLARSGAEPGGFGLHAAAVALQGRAIVLTGPARAGKTTLAVRLGLEPGARYICDDVLTITADNQARSLAATPRLRLPLPDNAALRALMARDCLLRDSRYAYLRMPAALPWGEALPLGAILSYERRGDLAPGLYALPVEAALPLLLRQALSEFDTAPAALERVHDLAQALPRARLVCEDPEQAVALILGFVAAGMPQDLPDLPPDPAAPLVADTLPDPQQVFVRATDAQLRQTGRTAWLWHEGHGTLWQLNPTAFAVWTLLEIPGSASDLAEVLADLTPDTPPLPVLQRDLCLCLSQLQRHGFLTAGPM